MGGNEQKPVSCMDQTGLLRRADQRSIELHRRRDPQRIFRILSAAQDQLPEDLNRGRELLGADRKDDQFGPVVTNGQEEHRGFAHAVVEDDFVRFEELSDLCERRNRRNRKVLSRLRQGPPPCNGSPPDFSDARLE